MAVFTQEHICADKPSSIYYAFSSLDLCDAWRESL